MTNDMSPQNGLMQEKNGSNLRENLPGNEFAEGGRKADACASVKDGRPEREKWISTIEYIGLV